MAERDPKRRKLFFETSNVDMALLLAQIACHDQRSLLDVAPTVLLVSRTAFRYLKPHVESKLLSCSVNTRVIFNRAANVCVDTDTDQERYHITNPEHIRRLHWFRSPRSLPNLEKYGNLTRLSLHYCEDMHFPAAPYDVDLSCLKNLTFLCVDSQCSSAVYTLPESLHTLVILGVIRLKDKADAESENHDVGAANLQTLVTPHGTLPVLGYNATSKIPQVFTVPAPVLFSSVTRWLVLKTAHIEDLSPSIDTLYLLDTICFIYEDVDRLRKLHALWVVPDSNISVAGVYTQPIAFWQKLMHVPNLPLRMIDATKVPSPESRITLEHVRQIVGE